MNPLFPALSPAAIETITRTLESVLAFDNTWSLRGLMEKSINADPSGITTAMLLAGWAASFGEETYLSLNDVLSRSPRFLAAVKTHQDVQDMLALAELDIIPAFSRNLEARIRATFRPGAIQKASPYLESLESLSFIRLNAVRSLQTLKRFQFTKGKRSPRRWHYNEWVHEFVNVNSMVAAALRQPIDGVTMTLIRDPDVPEYSFWCLLVKYGENVIVISDKPHFHNPEQKFMRRRPGRDLESRIEETLFPYQLLEVQRDSEESDLYVSRKIGNKIVRYQDTAHKLCEIVDLEGDQILWFAMVSELIHHQIVVPDMHEPGLSYTGEMLVVPDALERAAGKALVPQGYEPLMVPPLTLADVSFASVGKNFARSPTGFRWWMEELYGSQVNPQLFNVDASSDVALLGSVDGKEVLLSVPQQGELPSKKTGVLRFMDSTSMGSRAKILHDRLWCARANFATAIREIAARDFELKHREVEDWYRSRIVSNLPSLASAIVRGEFMAPAHAIGAFDKDIETPMRNILTTLESPFASAHATRIHSGYSAQHGHFYSVGAAQELASVCFKFAANTPGALAALCGCSVAELPIYLQHWWAGAEPYMGNSILDDVDPMEAKLGVNPWQKFPGQVQVFVSRRTLGRWRKGSFALEVFEPSETQRSEFSSVLGNGLIVERNTGKLFRAYPCRNREIANLDAKWKRNRLISVADYALWFDRV